MTTLLSSIQYKSAVEISSSVMKGTFTDKDKRLLCIWSRAVKRLGENCISKEAVSHLDSTIPQWREIYKESNESLQLHKVK